MISINYKEWCLFYRYVDRYIINKLYHREIFDLIVLIIINITFKILFNNLIESFYLSIDLKIKNCRKFAVYSEFCYEYYKES